MSKVKSSKAAAAKPSGKESKKLSTVKEGRVTKPAQASKAKSKDVAKSAAKVVEKKMSKKSKKAPTPEPESDSSESSESEAESTTSSSSESEEVETKAPAAAKAFVKKAAKAESSDSSDDSSDSSESESESESDSEDSVPAKTNGVKPAAAPVVAGADKSSSDSDSDSDSSEDDLKSAKTNGVAKASDASEADSSDSDSDSGSESGSGSDSDDSSSAESEKAEAPSKKRKAETEATPVTKKTKTEDASEGVKNLFVGNLSWNIDEEWLQREFEEFGEIVGCRVVTDRETGRARGFGYVEFATAEAAQKAKDTKHGAELDGRPMNIDFSTPRTQGENGAAKTNDRAKRFGDQRSAPSNTLFIGNISFDATNDMISEAFSEYGSITRVSLPTDQESGNLKGFGYVDFNTTEEAKAALEALNGADIAGRPIRLDYATPRDNNGGGRGGFGGRGRGGDRGGRGRGGFGGRGGGGFGGRGRGGDRGGRGGRGGSTNRGGFGEFKGKKVTF